LKKKGKSIKNIDFLIGGSGLDLLASRNTKGNMYVICKYKNLLTIQKEKKYTQDLNHFGF